MTVSPQHRVRPVRQGGLATTRRGSAEAIGVTLLIGALAVALWPLYLALQAPVPLQPAPVIAHVAGMLAGYGVLVLIALMSRSPLLERNVGADRLARWHGMSGRIVVLLVLVHAWAALESWAGSRGESVMLSLWHVLRLPWLIAATIGTVLLLAAGFVSARTVRKRVRHETWHTVHLLVYVGVALAFVHQLGGPDLAGHRVLQVIWSLMYTLVFALVIVHRVLAPLRNVTHHRMRVAQVIEERPGIVSIVIEGHALHELGSQPGQFFRWRFLAPDHWRAAHPFSLSAAPTENRLRLTVKSLGDGSTSLQRLERGTWVLAEGPYGAMTADRRTHHDVLLIAGGVGITPMRALFETMPLVPGQDLALLYRARTEDDLIFRHELDSIARARGARVHYLLGDIGPITPHLLTWYAPNLVGSDVYLCGPPGLSGAVRTALHEAGLPDRQLHEERFDL